VDRRDLPAEGQTRCGPHPQRHDLAIGTDAADACAVVLLGRDDPRDVGAMGVLDPIARARVLVVIAEVPAVDVVDEAVAVVVDPVRRGLARVGPQAVLQVGMLDVDARIEHRDHGRVVERLCGPGLGTVDIGVRRATALLAGAEALVRLDV